MPQAVPISLPFDEAIKFFQQKGYAISPNSWRDVWQDAHARAFTVARVTSMDILEDIRGEVQKALDDGTSLVDFKNNLTDRLTLKGWFAPEGEAAEIMLPDGTIRKRLAPWRLDTIYRANLQSAYSVGRYKQIDEVKDRRPYLQYKAIMDSRTRDEHAAMNNKIYRFDDPVWDEWYPPNGFNCRCYVKSLMEADLKERGLSLETGKPVDHPDEGWQYNVGKTGLYALQLQIMAYERVSNLSLKDQEFFINSMANAPIFKQAFSSWVDDINTKKIAEKKALAVGWFNMTILNYLINQANKPKSPIIAVTDDRILHSIRTSKGGRSLTIDEIKNIPDAIRNPEAVLYDTEKENLLYVFSSAIDPRKNKIVIEINYKLKGKGDVNLVTTAGKVDINNLKDKKYILVSGVLK